MKKISLCLALVMALAAVPALAANSVAAQTYAAQDGSYGLALAVDGSTNAAFVRDNTPSQETTYRAQFWVDRDGVGSPPPQDGGGPLFMDNCAGTCSTRFVMFRGADSNYDGGATEKTVFRIILRRLSTDNADGARYSVAFAARNDLGGFVYVGGIVLPETARRKWVTIEWQAASAPGANDGIARLFQGNTKGAANLVGEKTTIDNDLTEVDYIQLGAVSGLNDQATDPLSTGVLYFDTFESFRSLLP